MRTHLYSGYSRQGYGQTEFDLLAEAVTGALATEPVAPAGPVWIWSYGWYQTRASAIIAVLCAAYPAMTYEDILQWAMVNGIPNWTPNLSPSDGTLVGVEGTSGNADWGMYFDQRYNWPSNGQDLYTRWKSGEVISVLPSPYVAPEPVITPEPVVTTTTTTETGGMNPLAILFALFFMG